MGRQGFRVTPTSPSIQAGSVLKGVDLLSTIADSLNVSKSMIKHEDT